MKKQKSKKVKTSPKKGQPNPVPVQAVPIGTILPFAGPKNRAEELVIHKWLLCDGRQVSSDDYPELEDVIGPIYGGTGTPNFKIPDLRGMFLRGVDNDGSRDPDRNSRVNQEGHPITGTEYVGSREDEAYKSHNHANGDYKLLCKECGEAKDAVALNCLDQHPKRIDVVWSETIVSCGGNETRPKNVYVYYIIKAGYTDTELKMLGKK